MEKFKEYKESIWRVPLISLIAGFFYTPICVRIVLRFGVIEPGVIDDKVSLLTSAVLFLAVLFLGWIFLLRNLSRKEIFVSASVVVIYSVVLSILQRVTGSITGPTAVKFMYLFQPLEWTGFFSELGLYIQKHSGISIPFIFWLNRFSPLLFTLFGKKTSKQN